MNEPDMNEPDMNKPGEAKREKTLAGRLKRSIAASIWKMLRPVTAGGRQFDTLSWGKPKKAAEAAAEQAPQEGEPS